MVKKVKLNLIYAPQVRDPYICYKNNKGEIWHSKNRMKDAYNIGMSWMALKEPRSNESILAIEPYCVMPRDYDKKFVRKYRFIFTWATKAFKGTTMEKHVVPINHPSCKDLIARKTHGNDWLPWEERSNEIVFIANNKTSTDNSELYSLRIQLADLFHKESKYDVSWYGQIPLNGKSYYKGILKNKQKFLKTVKFSVCTENSYHPKYTHNYFTEKLPEVWGGGAVPLYMGCHNINSFHFPNNSYIDLRNFVKIIRKGKYNIRRSRLIWAVENYYKSEYEKYVKTVKNQILKPDKLFHHISYNRMYKTMIERYYKLRNNG